MIDLRAESIKDITLGIYYQKIGDYIWSYHEFEKFLIDNPDYQYL